MAKQQCTCRCLAQGRSFSGMLFNKQLAAAGGSLLFTSCKLSHCSSMPSPSRFGICRLMPPISMTGKVSHQPAICICFSLPPPTHLPSASSLSFASGVMEFFTASGAAVCRYPYLCHTGITSMSFSYISTGCLLGTLQKYTSALSVSCPLTLQNRLQLLWLL